MTGLFASILLWLHSGVDLMPLLGGFRSGTTSSRPAAQGLQPEPQRLVPELELQRRVLELHRLAQGLELIWLALLPAP